MLYSIQDTPTHIHIFDEPLHKHKKEWRLFNQSEQWWVVTEETKETNKVCWYLCRVNIAWVHTKTGRRMIKEMTYQRGYKLVYFTDPENDKRHIHQTLFHSFFIADKSPSLTPMAHSLNMLMFMSTTEINWWFEICSIFELWFRTARLTCL